MCLAVDPAERASSEELMECPIFLRRLNKFKNDIDLSGKVELLKPIKCPKVLKFINPLLPRIVQ